jgi:mxaJ protein
MSSGCSLAILIALASGAAAADLRVCADPDNLPYSNLRGQGFENELAQLVGHQLGRNIRYVWISARVGYFQALEDGRCDTVMGVPAQLREVRTTIPYYRSIYVFLTRSDRNLSIRSFDDPRLKSLRIGLQVMGADDATAPPAAALTARGMIRNVTWYRLYQNYLSASRPEALIEALMRGEVDVAIEWGPAAGYFSKTMAAAVRINPVWPQSQGSVPFAFDISMGVRRNDAKLAADLDSVLRRNAAGIRGILTRYGVPIARRPAEDSSYR